MHGNKGKKQSKEHITNRFASLKLNGYTHSQDTKDKIRHTLKGRTMPQEVRDKISESTKSQKRKIESTLKTIETRKRNGTWGMKHTEDSLRKIKETKIRNGTWKQKASKETKDKISKNHRHHQSKETRIKLSLVNTNEEVFKGFKSKFQKQLRNTSEYYLWRNRVFKRDNYTCQNPNCQFCNNENGQVLNAHHKLMVSKILKQNNISSLLEALNCSQLWEVDNGITYCPDFHLISHT